MRNMELTDLFTAVKKEPNFESESIDSIMSDDCLATIKHEPHCYIKEEIDLSFDEITSTDSDSNSLRETCSTLDNRPSSIITENISDSSVQNHHQNESKSEEITREAPTFVIANTNIENSSAIKRKKEIVKCNSVKKKRRESKRGANRFYESLCPKCNKKSQAKFTISKCDDCKVNLIYECLKCHKRLQSHTGISGHAKRVCFDQGCYYKCFVCDYKASLKHYVIHHIKRVHPDSLFKRFYNRIDRIKSNNTQADVSKVLDECTKCEQKFGNLNNLMKHAQHCNGSEAIVENESAIKIEKGPKQFSSDYQSTKTMMVRYCSKCNEEVSLDVVGSNEKKNCIKCHIKLLYKCLTCEKNYNTCIGTVMHILSKHIEKPKWNCPKCEFKTVSLSYLTSHYRRMHNPRFFDCQKCNRRLKSQEHLTRHMLRCGAERNLQCEHCPYKATKRKYMIQHIYNVHSSENRSVVCEKCNGTYKDQGVLKTHLRLYCGKEASLKCDHCSYKTKRKQCIELHITRHHMTEPTTYDCFKCKRKFKKKKFFENHILSCNVRLHIQCTVCPYKTFKRKFLKIHMSCIHPTNSIHK